MAKQNAHNDVGEQLDKSACIQLVPQNQAFSAFQPSSSVSSIRKVHQKTTSGTVDRCQSAWASMTRYHGGKSNTSNVVAAIVSATNTLDLYACFGRYARERRG